MCPRKCNADRNSSKGICLASDKITVSKVMLHKWEEPIISGTNGSGAMFFSGCNLKCVFCQNNDISHSILGCDMTQDEIYEACIRLYEHGAHNIDFITAAHYTEHLIPVLLKLKKNCPDLPLMWNSSGYESVETLKKLEGLIDIYLPDLKYLSAKNSLRFSKASDYPEIAQKALDEMFRQVKKPVIKDGLLKKGMIVRHLILPGQKEDTLDILDYLNLRYKDNIWISIMNQYVPLNLTYDFKDIDRRVTPEEYEEITDYASFIGITNAFIQESGSQNIIYTPDFKGDVFEI